MADGEQYRATSISQRQKARQAVEISFVRRYPTQDQAHIADKALTGVQSTYLLY
jgi:hypothetical protein